MNKKNKIIIISGISVASVALLATIISAFYTPKAPNPKELGARAKVSYIASKKFARLPEKEKTKYLSKMGHPRQQMFKNLSNKERKAVFKNTRKIMYKQIKGITNKFFKMSKEEQNKFLDTVITMEEKHRKAREAQSKQNGDTGITIGSRSAMMQIMLETTDSNTRAQVMEFLKRLQERRK